MLLYVATILWCLASLQSSAAVEVRVTDGQALVDAIRDEAVKSIVIDTDVRFEPGQWPSAVYRLDRNLTVTSDSSGRHKVIDFNARSVKSKLSIGAGYNLSFIHLTLKDTRYGAGADIDILAPSPNGIIFLHDLAKLQHSCPPLMKDAILAYQRDPATPGVNDITFPEHVEWDGKDYEGSILYNDFSTRMAGGGENMFESGYLVHKIHSYKLCEKVVSAECLSTADAATCVRQDMDAEYYAQYPEQPPEQLSAAAKAGLGAAVGIAGGAILAAAALFIERRRRLQRHEDLLPVRSKLGEPDTAPTVLSQPKTFEHFEAQDGLQPSLKAVVVHSSNGSSLSGALASPEATRDSAESGSTVDSMKLASTGKSTGGTGSGSGGSGKSVVVQMIPKVLEIIRGTMSKEQAATISLGTMVGAGSFGRVFHGSLGDHEVAIKVINHSGQTAKQVANEVELMMKFDHPNLVKAYHYVTWGSSGVSLSLSRPEHMDFTNSQHLPVPAHSPTTSVDGVYAPASRGESTRMVETWVISEYCNAGNLQDAIMLHNGGLFFVDSVPQMGVLLRTLLGVSNAMEWLHNRNVLHGDLKCANVMLHINCNGGAGAQDFETADASEELELVPKVVDFGLSRVITQGATHLSTHTFGTITHQPPELMRNGRLSKQADVYSFGVLMWEMIMAAHPWYGKMMGEIMTAVMIDGKRLEFPEQIPPCYARLARRCWEEDPSSRPTFAEVSAQIEHLMQKEAALQADVDAAYKAVAVLHANSATRTPNADERDGQPCA